ncbi:hypothetical protein GCM10010193_14500 [Kitasatospora atroaurantiaca]|uniref:Secreted protein n=1 Tax=Kitasatospora atroaurantiaca TaxID=285545 RepID=A0A561EI97_9ACTN|nr:hypothetical protein [Kitasatospora atroaurantiaca]TWE15338.1 hypothetical protein FB465_0230 [Kitasatospora atroaurantiaca]
MFKLRTLASTTAALALGAGLLIVGPAGPAQASAADCSHGANGFVDISDNASGTVQRSVSHFGDTITLQSAGGHGFAKIEGATTSSESVWMDWTQDGGRTWLQCGPFQVDKGNGSSKTSAAKATSSNSAYMFRACGYTQDGVITCTSWW